MYTEADKDFKITVFIRYNGFNHRKHFQLHRSKILSTAVQELGVKYFSSSHVVFN